MIRIRTTPDRLTLAPPGRTILSLEIDGVEVTGSRLSGAGDEILDSLLGGLCALFEGSRSELEVSFAEGAYELLVGLSDRGVLLSLASLRRPFSVIFRDLAVDPQDLLEAAIACGEAWLEADAEAVGDGGATSPGRLRGHLRRLARLRGANPLPDALVETADSPAEIAGGGSSSGDEGAPSFSFDQLDPDGRIRAYRTGSGLHALLAPGHLYVHGPDGEELAAVAGPPFLLLRDLSDAAGRMTDAERDGAESFRLPLGARSPPLELDLAGGALTVNGRTLRCAPSALARRIHAALLDFGAVIGARNAALASCELLVDALREAAKRLAACDERSAGPRRLTEPVPATERSARPQPTQPPIAPGALRRVSFRPAWKREFPRIRTFSAERDVAWIVHEDGASRVDLEDGTIKARLRVDPAASITVSEGSIYSLEAGALGRHGPDGRLRWRRVVPFERLDGVYGPGRSGLVWLHVDAAELVAVDPETGEERCRFAPPTARAAHAVATGSVLAVAADNGMIYGLDARSGSVAWRAPLVRAPEALIVAAGRVVVVARERGRVTLDAFDAGTGESGYRVSTSLARFAGSIADARGVVLAGMGASVAEVVRVDGAGGLKWVARPNLGEGEPALVRAGGALFVRGPEGVARIERGRVRWNVPCGPGGAPVSTQGMLVLPGERPRLLDAPTGRPIMSHGPLPAADRVVVTAKGTWVFVDQDGTCSALRPSGALAVV